MVDPLGPLHVLWSSAAVKKEQAGKRTRMGQSIQAEQPSTFWTYAREKRYKRMQAVEITMLNTDPEQQRVLLKTRKGVISARTAWKKSLICHLIHKYL